MTLQFLVHRQAGLAQIEGPLLVFLAFAAAALAFAVLTGKWD